VADAGVPWAALSDGVVLTVRLTPRGGRDAIDGIEQMADGRAMLKVRVRAVPNEGEANAALVKVIARAMRVPARSIEIVAGATIRVKRLRIAGDAAMLTARLWDMIAAQE